MKNITQPLPIISQISVDCLFGITQQPFDTCPFIDLLTFNGKEASRVYAVDISYDLSTLLINTQQLVDRTLVLHKWANDVAHLHDSIPSELIGKTDTNSMTKLNEYSLAIKLKSIENQRAIQDKLSNLAEGINDKLTEAVEYYDKNKKLYIQQREQSVIVKDLNDKLNGHDWSNVDGDPEGIMGAALKDELDFAKEELTFTESDIFDNNAAFQELCSDSFNYLIEELINSLDDIRTNNITIRTQAYHIQTNLEDVYKTTDYYNLKQPMDYLQNIDNNDNNDNNEGVIALGVLSNKNDSLTFTQLCSFLNKNHILNDVQKSVISNFSDKQMLIDLLHKSGYHTVRYYESAEQYLANPELYQESKIKPEQTHKLKITP